MMETMTRFSKINILLDAATPTAQEIIVQCDARIIYNFTITPYLTIYAMTMVEIHDVHCYAEQLVRVSIASSISECCIHEMIIFSVYKVGN